MAVELAVGEAGAWETAFPLPAGVAGLSLMAELRSLPAGELALVEMGEPAVRLTEVKVWIRAARPSGDPRR